MKINKKYLTLIAVLLVLVLVIFINHKLNQDETIDNEVKNDISISTLSGDDNSNEQAGKQYFESFREERESVRALEIDYLDEIIATSANDAETLKDAQEQKLSIVNNMEKEFTIESLIKAKGFDDAAVTFHAGSVNVVVDCAALTEEQVAQILDVVRSESGVEADKVKVMANVQ